MRLPRPRSLRIAVLACSALAAPLVLPPLSPATQAREAPASFADLAARLLPAVVNISSSQVVQAQNGGPELPMFPPGSPFEQLFKDFMNRQHRGQGGNAPKEPEQRLQSLGSGFIIDSSGLIVTNNHVIEGADQITVTLQDGTTLKATVVGRDTVGDIALLRVKPTTPLAAVSFGDSDKERVGDWVLAIGNPFGLGGTVTAGIVSARGRNIHQGPYDDFLQTDAPINQGNSGGPLFNMDGQVIAMNTAIYSRSGGSVGIGFSIPANMVKDIVAQLREYGHPRRGWLGVRIQEVTPDIAESLGLKKPRGALVAGVNDDGPADKAHLQNGDVVLKFNNEDVPDMHALPRIVADTAVGKTVPVEVWRNGKDVTLQATLAEKPDDVQQAAAPATKPVETAPTDIAGLGMKLAPISPELRNKYQLNPDQKGVVVTDVAPNGSAAQRGVKPGDVIVEVQQGEVNTPAEVQQRIDGVRKEDRKSVLMLIQRQDGMQWVPVPLSGGTDKQPG